LQFIKSIDNLCEINTTMKSTIAKLLVFAFACTLVFTSCFKDDLLKEIDALKETVSSMQRRNDSLSFFINAKADSLGKALTAAQKRSDSLASILKTKSDSLSIALGITNTNLATLTKSVDSIKVQVANINGQLTQLNNQLTNVTAQLNQLNQQFGALGADYASLNAKYQELSATLQALNTQIAALQAEQLTLLAKLNEILATLNNPINNTSASLGNSGTPNPWSFPLPFDGGYIPLGNFGAQSRFSISMWINPAQVQNGISIILDAAHGGSANWVIQTLNSGSTWTWGTGTFTLTPNSWQHLLLTYDNGNRKIFINGAQVLSWNQLINYAGSPSLYLGNWPEGARRFTGFIDELYITTDIQQISNFTPLKQIDTPSNNTFGLWHFDEGTGSTTKEHTKLNIFNIGSWNWTSRPL
jgi:prefoldin subunit 5